MLERLINHYKVLYGRDISLTALEVELKKFVLDNTMKTDMILISKFARSQIRTVSDALAVIKELEEVQNGHGIEKKDEEHSGEHETGLETRVSSRKTRGSKQS